MNEMMFHFFVCTVANIKLPVLVIAAHPSKDSAAEFLSHLSGSNNRLENIH